MRSTLRNLFMIVGRMYRADQRLIFAIIQEVE
jgi:hypothetical protein